MQITPLTREWRHRRVEMARQGLAALAKFDPARLTDDQRVSADLMKWQLDVVVEGEQYDDFVFPLEQFAGANIDLVNALTVVHPLNTEKDALNYVARLGQVATRMDEADRPGARAGSERNGAATLHRRRNARPDEAVHRRAAGTEPVRDRLRRAHDRER